MTAGPSAGSMASPLLVVRTRERVHRLRPGGTYRVGRDPESEIVVTDGRVSWHHANLRSGPDGWVLEDAGSRNGVFLDGRRVQRVVIDGEHLFRLGHATDGAPLACSAFRPSDPRPAVDRSPSQVFKLPTPRAPGDSGQVPGYGPPQSAGHAGPVPAQGQGRGRTPGYPQDDRYRQGPARTDDPRHAPGPAPGPRPAPDAGHAPAPGVAHGPRPDVARSPQGGNPAGRTPSPNPAPRPWASGAPVAAGVVAA
ncbi:FHA domain-containing protein, partial [Spirillospora sp. NPDC049652]